MKLFLAISCFLSADCYDCTGFVSALAASSFASPSLESCTDFSYVVSVAVGAGATNSNPVVPAAIVDFVVSLVYAVLVFPFDVLDDSAAAVASEYVGVAAGFLS